MTSRDEIANKVLEFLVERFSLDPNEPGFDRDAHLWQSGFLDSIALAEILVFIEGAFSVTLPDFVLVDEKFGSVNGLAAATLTQLSRRAAK